MKSVKEADVKGKTVVVRIDANVPVSNGRVTSDARLRAVLPTLQFLLKKKAKVILLSHLGRPEGVVDEFRLKPIASSLSKLLRRKVRYIRDCVGPEVRDARRNLRAGEILLLENLRFYKEEEADNEEFAQMLAEGADLYVNEAFSVSHRAHASVHAITKFLPSYAGFALLDEIKNLSVLLKKQKRPFIAVMGGAKVSDKLGVIQKLAKRVDCILIGGAMMFTFLKALGNEVGKSKVEDALIEQAKELLKKFKKKILLPVDVVLQNKKVVSVHNMPKNLAGLDIGPETSSIYAEMIHGANALFWNGPLGMVERKPFDRGTIEVAKAASSCKGLTVVGGGDSVAVIEKLKLEKKFSFVSSGGGASLEFVEGKVLPGLVALDKP